MVDVVAHPSPVLEQTSAFVEKSLAGNDASHDFAHIQRVYALAKTIEKSEKCTDDGRRTSAAEAGPAHSSRCDLRLRPQTP